MENLTTEQKLAILKANREVVIDFMFDAIDRYFTWVKPTLAQKQQHMGKFMSLIIELWDGKYSNDPASIADHVFFMAGNRFRNLCEECFTTVVNKSADMQYAQNEISERRNNQMKFQSC